MQVRAGELRERGNGALGHCKTLTLLQADPVNRKLILFGGSQRLLTHQMQSEQLRCGEASCSYQCSVSSPSARIYLVSRPRCHRWARTSATASPPAPVSDATDASPAFSQYVRPDKPTYAPPSIVDTGTLRPPAEWFPAWMKYRSREDNYVFWQDKFSRNSLDITCKHGMGVHGDA